jgi:hypothetical protein
VLPLVGTTTLPSHIFSFFRQSAKQPVAYSADRAGAGSCCQASASAAGPWRCLLIDSGFGSAAYNGNHLPDISSCCVSTARMCSVGVSGSMHSRSPQFARSRGSSWLAPALHQQDIVGLVDVILFCCHVVYVVRGTH